MVLQLVTFRLAGIAPEAYAAHCEAVAPRFAEEPGLRSKVWIAGSGADADADLRGGVYLWQDRRWAERHAAGPLRRALLENDGFAGAEVREFAVMEAPTAVTRWGFAGAPA